jgi:hypothetical protein
MRYTSQQAGFQLAFEPVISHLFAQSSWDTVSQLALYVSENNPYGENSFLKKALNAAFPNRVYVEEDFIRHQLWCNWREAQWQNRRLNLNSTKLKVVNAHYCEETEGHPTLLVSPMTTAVSDALLLLKHLHNDRPVILYGQDIESIQLSNDIDPSWIAGDGLQALKRIQNTLSANGVLCTYPDFVYSGHASCPMPFMGTYRALASGYASLASKRHNEANTMLLPCVLLHENEDEIVVHFEEPIEIDDQGDIPKSYRQTAIVGLIGSILEDLIQLAGPQWLLLPTLTYSSPQMAREGALIPT